MSHQSDLWKFIMTKNNLKLTHRFYELESAWAISSNSFIGNKPYLVNTPGDQIEIHIHSYPLRSGCSHTHDSYSISHI